MSKTYQETKANKTFLTVLKNGESIGVFTNFRTACTVIKEKDDRFLSYWHLVRNKTNPYSVVVGDDTYVFTDHHLNTLFEDDDVKKTVDKD